MLNERDIKKIKKVVEDEREYGHLLCDFDDYENDERMIAEVLGYDVWWDDDDEMQIEDRDYVDEALSYYYELHA